MQPVRKWCALTAVSLFVSATPATAQEFALKGLIAISHFGGENSAANPWDDRLTTTAFGGHVRFRFGALALQPELQIVTRGASKSVTESEDEQLRLEYLEVPVLLVFPVRVARLEPYVFAGSMVALESRCRYVVKEEGLRSNFGCDSAAGTSAVFERRKVDYGLVGGGGASYPLGSGRVLVEARHTWGFRNIADLGDVQDAASFEAQHRTFMIGIGYTINLAENR